MNNLALLHARDAFRDGAPGAEGEAGGKRRHIVRLWLRADEGVGWGVPTGLEVASARVYGDDDEEERWTAEPERGEVLRARRATSCGHD